MLETPRFKFFLPLRLIAFGGYYRHGPGSVATFYDGWLFTTAVGRAFSGICRYSLFKRVRFSLLKDQPGCTSGFFIIDILPCTSFLFI